MVLIVIFTVLLLINKSKNNCKIQKTHNMHLFCIIFSWYGTVWLRIWPGIHSFNFFWMVLWFCKFAIGACNIGKMRIQELARKFLRCFCCEIRYMLERAAIWYCIWLLYSPIANLQNYKTIQKKLKEWIPGQILSDTVPYQLKLCKMYAFCVFLDFAVMFWFVD